MSNQTLARQDRQMRDIDDSPLRGAIKDAEDHIGQAIGFAVGEDFEVARLLLAKIFLSMTHDQMEELFASGWFGDMTNALVKLRPVGIDDMQPICEVCDSSHAFGCPVPALETALGREFGGGE